MGTPRVRWLVRRRLADRAALPALIEALGAALRSGLSLEFAFAEVAPTLPAPLDRAAFRVAAALRTGASLDRAIACLDGAARADDVAPFALVLGAFHRGGGRVGRSLSRVAELLRSRIALDEERKALTAQARVSAMVLVVLPPAGLLLVLVGMPDYAATFWTRGVGLLALACVLEIVGALWLQRVVRPTRDMDDLASLLDAVVVGLDAGLTFEQSLSRLVGRVPRLAHLPKARRLLADLSLGRGNNAAFAAFAANGAAEARVAALVASAGRLGAPLSDLLVLQVDGLRGAERRRVEERARRLPVLMLFPLSFCILPALMIVFLGPAILSLLE